MPDPQARNALIEQTLDLLGTSSPGLRAHVEVVVDRLPHIFSYGAEHRPQMVRFHVLKTLQRMP